MCEVGPDRERAAQVYENVTTTKGIEMAEEQKCAICGEPMPTGEEMFKFHGYSGNCPKPPLPKTPIKQKIQGLVWAVAAKDKRTVSMMFDTDEQANAFVAGIEADEPPNVKLRGRAL